MGIWTDIAEWRGPTPNHSGPMLEQRGVVVHIAEGGYEGTISWCKNPASSVSCHFVVAADGRIAQLADTDVTVWTQIAGNGHWISVENEGFTPNQLTEAQVEANARILAKAHQVYGVPLQIATDPTGRGLGHHSMGTNGGSVPTDTWTGPTWGHTDCPGPNIIAQKPAIVALAGGDDMNDDQARRLNNIDSMMYYGMTLGQDVPAGQLSLGGGVGTPTTAPTPVWTVVHIKALEAKIAELEAKIDALQPVAGVAQHSHEGGTSGPVAE